MLWDGLWESGPTGGDSLPPLTSKTTEPCKTLDEDTCNVRTDCYYENVACVQRLLFDSSPDACRNQCINSTCEWLCVDSRPTKSRQWDWNQTTHFIKGRTYATNTPQPVDTSYVVLSEGSFVCMTACSWPCVPPIALVDFEGWTHIENNCITFYTKHGDEIINSFWRLDKANAYTKFWPVFFELLETPLRRALPSLVQDASAQGTPQPKGVNFGKACTELCLYTSYVLDSRLKQSNLGSLQRVIRMGRDNMPTTLKGWGVFLNSKYLNGYLSTTNRIDSNIFNMKGKGNILVYLTVINYNGRSYQLTSLSQFPGEFEVLLPRDCRIEVQTFIEDSNDKVYLTCNVKDKQQDYYSFLHTGDGHAQKFKTWLEVSKNQMLARTITNM